MHSERCNVPCGCRAAAAEVFVRMQKIHPERFDHAAHFLVQKIHPESYVPVERARCLVAITPALHDRSTNMRNSKSSHPQCPPRLHQPPHTQNTGIHLAFPWVFALLLNPTTNTPHRCCSSGHPTCVFAALTRPPPCHSKSLPTCLPPRVPCVHPSTPLIPSPPHQCALTAHFTLRAFSRNHLLLHTSVLSPRTSTCALSRALTPAHSRTSTRARGSPPR